MKVAITLLAICLALPAMAQDKSSYDLVIGAAKASGQASFPEYVNVRNEQLEASMLSGGYFTLGTAAGPSASTLDDQCAITYGHPYAKTSHLVFSVDGDWYRLEDYFSNDGLTLEQSEDALRVQARSEGDVMVTFTVVLGEGHGALLQAEIGNFDDVSHTFRVGVALDPALGRWGDGHLTLGSESLRHGTRLRSPDLPEVLTLWERDSAAKGLGVDFSFFDPTPDLVVAGNWARLHGTDAPEDQPATEERLYDLALKVYWGETQLAPGETRLYQMAMDLRPPDFNTPVFVRWDLPSSFVLTDNLMFPRDFKSYLEIVNNSGRQVNATVSLDLPTVLDAVPSEHSLFLDVQPVYHQLDMRSNLVFEDGIFDVGVEVTEGGEILDKLHRAFFLPATPVSDTGLVVRVDTVDLTHYPEVALTFEVREEAEDRLITRLAPENLFLFENDQRLREFSLKKDRSSGVDAADIVFVLDVTGSMEEEIDGVKNHIVEFADSLSYRGIDFRLGMVTFLDVIENVYPFTRDVQAFRALVGEQFAHGGDDTPENSLEALMEATRFLFRPEASRVVIWITDANYHERNSMTPLSRSEVIDALLANEITVHSVGNTSYRSAFYEPFTVATGGRDFDIYGNFRDVLLEISRFEVFGKFVLTYLSPAADRDENRIELKIRHAGLGGMAVLSYLTPSSGKAGKRLSFFPNPFNSEINFLVNSGDYARGTLHIYNLLGQEVAQYRLRGTTTQRIAWNAAGTVATGPYLARLALVDFDGEVQTETARILYLK